MKTQLNETEKKIYEEMQKKCAEEKIHIPGCVQPYACLIILDKNLNIQKFSENISQILPIQNETLLSKNISDYLDDSSMSQIRSVIKKENQTENYILSLTFKDELAQAFSAFLYAVNGLFILEIEKPKSPHHREAFDTKDTMTKTFLKGGSLSERQQFLVDAIRSITKHDRILLYIFDPEWNGKVVAESSATDAKPYLGLHFPASDIPKQARDLYHKKALRYIPDVGYTPQKMIPDDRDKNEQPIDLSLVSSRSISPIHQQYMNNMGIAGSMSFAVFQNECLHGLVICHSKAPNFVSPYERASAMNIVTLYSALLSRADSEALEEAEKRKRECMAELAAIIRDPSEQSKTIEAVFTNLLKFMGACGVIFSVGEKQHVFGDVPSEQTLNAIITELNNRQGFSVFTSNSIENDLGAPYDAASKICGVLAYPKPGKNQQDFIVWFRKEDVVERNWAGNPIKQIQKSSMAMVPRENFEVWKQIYERHSKAWSIDEQELAQEIAHITLAITQMILVQQNNQILQQATQERQKLEALGRMTGNISHEIKNTLQPVKLMADTLKDWKNLDETQIERCIAILSDNVSLADHVIQDVLRFSRKSDNHPEKIATKILKEEVISFVRNLLHSRIDYKTDIGDQTDRDYHVEININSLCQILMNIVNNALYAMNDIGQLTLRWNYNQIDSSQASALGLEKGAYLCIGIEDSGCGMDEKIIASAFDPFFSTKPPGEGTGLGLSISYRIVKEWNGTITVTSALESGSTFTIFLPVVNQYNI
jgi:chemotaxis family two-component system sensor kinase Cph1